jgi:hypothetical protein
VFARRLTGDQNMYDNTNIYEDNSLNPPTSEWSELIVWSTAKWRGFVSAPERSGLNSGTETWEGKTSSPSVLRLRVAWGAPQGVAFARVTMLEPDSGSSILKLGCPLFSVPPL